MGNTLLQTCQTCKNTTGGNKQPNQISQFYSSRLAQLKQMLPNLPYYQNVLYVRLVNDLRNRQQKFVDMVLPNQQLLNDNKIQWIRITDVFPYQKFCKSKNFYQFQYKKQIKSKNPTANLAIDLEKLSRFPQLIQKIFANTQISIEGFYVLYFCIGGNLQKKIQIIIDDYIPVNSNGKYLFQQPTKGSGIWMILVQKAWAKLLKSYHHLQNINSSYFFSQMTGVPKQQLYNRGDFLMSSKYDFNRNQSKYLKISRDQAVEMIICIWSPNIMENFYTDMQPADFIAEVIVASKQPQLLPLVLEKNSSKAILVNKNNRGMFILPVGQSIIHIFNKSRTKRSCNIVIHARSTVNFHTRYQKQFQDAKFKMVKNQYKKIHFKIGTQFQNPTIQLKFIWMDHRGIFCLKNKSNQIKKIELCIKKQYINEIFFQDFRQMNKIINLNPNQYAFFVLIRQQYKQYGPFYQINVKKFP